MDSDAEWPVRLGFRRLLRQDARVTAGGILLKLTITVFLMYGCLPAHGEPYLAIKTGNPCSACHVDPTGGGMRNSYGVYYGDVELPATPIKNIDYADYGLVTDALGIGSDVRFNLDNESPDEGEDKRGFQLLSGQIYLAIRPPKVPVSIYIDEQVAPAGALNRQAFIMLALGTDYILRAGKFILPYGLRLEDDSAFIRQATQVNFHSSDIGIDLIAQYSQLTVNLFVTNGTQSPSNDDNTLQLGARGEFISQHWRLGASAIHNDADIGARTMANVFGGFTYDRYTFLLEHDFIKDESRQNIPGTASEIFASLAELNIALIKGYNLKLTTEFLDPDRNIDENEQTRYSVLLEYFPFAFTQLRMGLRVKDGIPQAPEQNTHLLFGQIHAYF